MPATAYLPIEKTDKERGDKETRRKRDREKSRQE
jgi:hypothetical protein